MQQRDGYESRQLMHDEMKPDTSAGNEEKFYDQANSILLNMKSNNLLAFNRGRSWVISVCGKSTHSVRG